MARMGKFSSGDLKRLQQNLNKLQNDAQINAFCESCAKELAARLLAKVIKRTPVGQYPKGSGKKGGTLRRGWTSQKGSGSEGLNTRGAAQFVDTLKVNHFGDTYVIEIVNPVEYASYVEYGHRTSNHKGWVKGQFMMTISEQELEQIAPKVLENKLKKFLGGAFQ
jgi:hypothetical protein